MVITGMNLQYSSNRGKPLGETGKPAISALTFVRPQKEIVPERIEQWLNLG